MRKCNAILSAGILVLFLVHGVLGAFNLMGTGNVTTRVLAWILVGLIGLHTLLGAILTGQTLAAQKKSGKAYWKENRLFWARRISGFAVMVLIVFHILAFSTVTVNGGLRLPLFDAAKLITQILLVLAIALHVITNVKPMLLSFGVPKLKVRVHDVVFWLAVLLLLMTAGFIIYYVRWGAV